MRTVSIFRIAAFAVVLFLALSTTFVYSQSDEKEPTQIEITARRFEFNPDIIRVKKGQTVELRLSSEDVTHGFGLPAFGINVKVDKGEETIVRFKATKAGRFPFRCTLFCGAGHGRMNGTLVVE